jgi:hypothetical protein
MTLLIQTPAPFATASVHIGPRLQKVTQSLRGFLSCVFQQHNCHV